MYMRVDSRAWAYYYVRSKIECHKGILYKRYYYSVNER